MAQIGYFVEKHETPLSIHTKEDAFRTKCSHRGHSSLCAQEVDFLLPSGVALKGRKQSKPSLCPMCLYAQGTTFRGKPPGAEVHVDSDSFSSPWKAQPRDDKVRLPLTPSPGPLWAEGQEAQGRGKEQRKEREHVAPFPGARSAVLRFWGLRTTLHSSLLWNSKSFWLCGFYLSILTTLEIQTEKFTEYVII